MKDSSSTSHLPHSIKLTTSPSSRTQRRGQKARASQKQKPKHPPENTICPPSIEQTHEINSVSRCIVHRRDSERGTYTSAMRTKANLRLEGSKKNNREGEQAARRCPRKKEMLPCSRKPGPGTRRWPLCHLAVSLVVLVFKIYLLRQAQMLLSAHPVFITIHVRRRLFPILFPVTLTRINQHLSLEARRKTALAARAAAALPDHAVKHFPPEKRRSSLTSRKTLV